jgi:hypothetical protein
MAEYVALSLAIVAATPTPVDWLTVFVGFATIAQAFFAFFALRGLRDSRQSAQAATETLRLTKETSERQLRAYICYKKGRFDALMVGKPLTCFLEFENCGATPAYELFAFGNCVVVPSIDGYDYPPPPAAVLADASRTTLGANNSTALLADSDGPLTAETLADITAGKLSVVVYGAVEYLDAFRSRRETPFRLNLQLGDASAPNGRLWLCSQGNSAD